MKAPVNQKMLNVLEVQHRKAQSWQYNKTNSSKVKTKVTCKIKYMVLVRELTI